MTVLKKNIKLHPFTAPSADNITPAAESEPPRPASGNILTFLPSRSANEWFGSPEEARRAVPDIIRRCEEEPDESPAPESNEAGGKEEGESDKTLLEAAKRALVTKRKAVRRIEAQIVRLEKIIASLEHPIETESEAE